MYPILFIWFLKPYFYKTQWSAPPLSHQLTAPVNLLQGVCDYSIQTKKQFKNMFKSVMYVLVVWQQPCVDYSTV